MRRSWPERALEGGSRAVLDPPRIVFHVVMGMISVGLLWVGSLPGFPFVPLMLLGWLVLFGALIWAAKLVTFRRRSSQGAPRPAVGRWFLLAPIGGVLIAGVLLSDVAFDARWALSQASFDEAVIAATDPADTSATPDRLGLYRVLGEPRVIGDAVFFDHPMGGGVFDDAGFAYLPAGPTPDLDASFERLRTQQIDGSWYRWWSSW